MNIANLHAWPQNLAEAVALQKRLAKRIVLQPIESSQFHLVAGVDVSSTWRGNELWAAVVVLQMPKLEIREEAFATGVAPFPYVPGLLSFREIPVILAALKKLKMTPEVIICDGQGLAHPRFLGLAAHLGLWVNLPTVGCAKSRLVGEYRQPGREKGNWEPLLYGEREVGVVLRSKAHCRPVYVSPGHLMDIERARQLVLDCCVKARLPEPTRLAHLAVNRYRRTCSLPL